MTGMVKVGVDSVQKGWVGSGHTLETIHAIVNGRPLCGRKGEVTISAMQPTTCKTCSSKLRTLIAIASKESR